MNDPTTGMQEAGMQEEGFRLSPAQKRLWTLASAGNAAFYVWGTFRIKKSPEVSRLKRAIEKVVEKHEILRTALKQPRNFRLPMQIISEAAAFHFDEHDITHLSEAEQADFTGQLVTQAAQALAEESARFSVALLKTSAAEKVLMLFLPAYFCDRTGLINLMTEIASAYQSLEASREYEPESPQFADISEWQNANLESDETRSAREFWKNARRLLAEQATLPIENKSAAGDFRPDSVEGVVSGELFEQLKRRSESSGNIEAWLLACWTAMLFKYLDRAEITVGVAFDGREFPELKQSIGNLTRYAPLINSLYQLALSFGVRRCVSKSTW